MSLRLKKLTQLHGGGCSHYKAELELDGDTEALEVSLYQLEEYFSGFPGGYKRAILLGLLQYQIEQGVPVSKLPRRVRVNSGN